MPRPHPHLRGTIPAPGFAKVSWILVHPALDSSAHFSRRLALAQCAFALIRRLSPPGAGLAPYLYHRLPTSLVAPIFL